MTTLTTIEGIDGAGKTTAMNALEELNPNAVRTREPNDSSISDSVWNTTDWFGEQVRTAISSSEEHPVNVFFYFMADHAYHYANTIQPALDSGHSIICDRYIGSRYAYQSISLDEIIHGDTLDYLMKLHEHDIQLESNPVYNEIMQVAEVSIPDELLSNVPTVSQYFYGLAASEKFMPSQLSNVESDLPGYMYQDASPAWSKVPDVTILLDLPVEIAIERSDTVGEDVFENIEFLEKVRKQYKEIATRTERYVVVDASQTKQNVKDDVISAYQQN